MLAGQISAAGKSCCDACCSRAGLPGWRPPLLRHMIAGSHYPLPAKKRFALVAWPDRIEQRFESEKLSPWVRSIDARLDLILARCLI